MLHAKYAFRPFNKHIPQQKLFNMLVVVVPGLLLFSQTLGRIPVVGRYLKRLLPIADYTGIFPLSKQQLQEWALLDTFDMLASAYDKSQTSKTVRHWLEKVAIVDIDVSHESDLVGRGLKPV